ncbi:hypothetical protein CTHBC1_2681 [Acetivibrio thermocellus BC1]|nr:hypothetical protein CTHBC1_2681 [Acetivibrio thermocellus BC1]
MPQPITNLSVGAKIKFGSIYNQPIVWLVAAKNHAGYPSGAITLVTERIIKLMCVDAKEPSNSNSDRRNYGNNRYIHSNIRKWLNSKAGAGQWYEPQHAADAPPTEANVWNNHNPYDQQAGFLNAFSENERNAILDTTLTAVKSSIDGGGSETFQDKVFLLSTTEVGLANESGIAEGSRLDLFTTDNSSRLCYPTAAAISNNSYSNSSLAVNKPWYWWLRTPYASSAHGVRSVYSNGSLTHYLANNGSGGLRPALNLSSSILVSDTTDEDGCYTVVWNAPPTKPSSITVPAEVIGGEQALIKWGASTDPDGNLAGYRLERKVDNGAFTQIAQTNVNTRQYTDDIQWGWNTVRYRVKAYDTNEAESDYETSNPITVINNRPPVISGEDGDLGTKNEGFGQSYTVTDPDAGAVVTVVEKLDGKEIRTYTATLGATNTFDITGDRWVKLLNGPHTMTITATDQLGASVTRTWTFTKSVTSIEFTLTNPLPADDMPTKCIINITGSLPLGSELTVEVCNNGNDEEPTWEDITQKVLDNQKHFFQNTTKTAEEWGFNLRVKLERGTATGLVAISSIGGNFE